MQWNRGSGASAALIAVALLAWTTADLAWGQTGGTSGQGTTQGTGQAGTQGTGQQQPGTREAGDPARTQPAPGTTRVQPSSPGTTSPGTTQSPRRAQPGQTPGEVQTRDATGRRETTRFDFGAEFRTSGNNLMIGTVQEDGFFASAGLREGDQIISVDGRTITTEREFRDFLVDRRGRVPVVVLRNGERQRLFLNMDEFSQAGGARYTADQSDTPAPKSALGIWFHSYPQGTHVVHVVPGSPAAEAGLQRGDWIMRIDGALMDDWRVLAGAIAHAEPGKKVDLLIHRDGQESRLEANLAAYQEVFADNRDWSQIAAEHGYQTGYGSDMGYEGRSQRYWTGEQSTEFRGTLFQRPMRQGQSDAQNLERRIQMLEQEINNLKQQLGQGVDTRAPSPTSAPAPANAPNRERNNANREQE